LCHKNGSRRILESTASTIRNDKEEVEKLVIVNRDITDRKHAEEQLAHNALHDAMTGLPNRRLFLDRLQRCFAEAQRDFTFHYAVVLLDLDRFKIFNDTMGTVAGDQMIVEIATPGRPLPHERSSFASNRREDPYRRDRAGSPGRRRIWDFAGTGKRA